MRPFQEEKLNLALFHHHLLAAFWRETLPKASHAVLRRIIPKTWVMDATALPPGAVLDGPVVNGQPLHDWRDFAKASKRERDYIIKISGYHETAWGHVVSRSAVIPPSKLGRKRLSTHWMPPNRICILCKPITNPRD